MQHVRILAAAAVAVATVLCGPAPAQTPTQHPAPTPLTVQLDWKPTAQFAGILVAKQQGFYSAEGLDVTVLPVDNSNTTSIARVSAHANDATGWIGITEADLLLSEQAKGAPVKAFATMLQTTPFALLTLKSSGLTTIRSLKGKTIGLHDDGQKAIDVLLGYNGMNRSEINAVKIPYSIKPLLTGQVDAMQGYVIDEAVRLRMEGHPIHIIPMGDNGYVSYAEVLFAPSNYLRTHTDALARFLRATGRGWAYAAAHTDAVAHMIVTKYAPESTFGEQRASLLAVLPLLHTESPHFGAMLPDTWARSIQMFETYQLTEGKLSAKDAVDYSVLERLYGK
jgi:NitT/TauT family transport system substrate-binding protein